MNPVLATIILGSVVLVLVALSLLRSRLGSRKDADELSAITAGLGFSQQALKSMPQQESETLKLETIGLLQNILQIELNGHNAYEFFVEIQYKLLEMSVPQLAKAGTDAQRRSRGFQAEHNHRGLPWTIASLTIGAEIISRSNNGMSSAMAGAQSNRGAGLLSQLAADKAS
jgi:hypothetical protein